jgi:hypothetical protein
MKGSLYCALFLIGSVAFAGDFISGESSLVSFDNGGRQELQVSISGAPAEALYNALSVEENPLSDEHGGLSYGAYKNGTNIHCQQTYGHYSCSMNLDTLGNAR